MTMRAALIITASLAAASAHGAYIFEIDTDGLDDGIVTFNPDFSFGGDTTTASQSAPSMAFGASGADSIFGGDGSQFGDTYLYTYAPDAQPDNLAIPAGTDLGEGNVATGLTGGGAGLYRVYATWPGTTNVSGGLVNYTVTTGIDAFSIDIDQNGGGAGRGDAWVLLGEIDYDAGAIRVTQTASTNTFISMRAYGLLFERVPAPGTAVLMGLGAIAATRRRR